MRTIMLVLRYLPRVANRIGHPPRLLVVHGRLGERQVRRAALAREDLFGLLRR